MRKVILLLVLVSCAGTKVKAKTGTIDQEIQLARANGAVRCAPVELAMAESHNDFAKEDLSLGRYHDAVRESDIASENAQKAVEKSPKELCNPDSKPPEVALAPPKDTDGDGILDPDDDCPRKPEDKDGYQDEDGCPDDDNDGDGVPECPQVVDQCPDSANPDTPDGCPKKYDLVVVTETKIELKQTVYFDTNKATIKKRSYALLDDVSKALDDYPKIKVRIEGHTDSQGNDRHNKKLSQKRADSVRKYLIGKGIDPGRMVSVGYGEEVPIADNRTKAGRAQNRRVEFFITDH